MRKALFIMNLVTITVLLLLATPLITLAPFIIFGAFLYLLTQDFLIFGVLALILGIIMAFFSMSATSIFYTCYWLIVTLLATIALEDKD